MNPSLSTTHNTSTPSTPATRTRCEIWNRVMGYFRPVSQFNKGKKSEFYSRKYFHAERSMANERFNATFTSTCETPVATASEPVAHV